MKFVNFDYDPSSPADYQYPASLWRQIQMQIVSNGIIIQAGADLSVDNSLKVAAISGGVNIADGVIAIQGAFGIVENAVSAEKLLFSTDGTYKVVLEFNSVLNKIYPKTISGATALTRTATVWQLQLATVVKSGSTYTVTDTRTDTTLCGCANSLGSTYFATASSVANIVSGATKVGNADKLDGQDSTWFATASSVANIVSGATKVGNADKLDDHDSSYFALASSVGNMYSGATKVGNADKLDGQDSTYFATASSVANIVSGATTANGTYTKFNDGTMICRIKQIVADQAITSAYGSLFLGSRTWTFPAPFIDTVNLVVSPGEGRWGTGASWQTSASAVVTSSCQLNFLDTISRATGTNFIYSATAIGRWK